jgi:hypothetical protein
MAKLTIKYIKETVAKDPRLDPEIDLDEYGKAIVYTRDGWTWCAADGNRTVEGFLISDDNCDGDPCDTVGYFRETLRFIERVGV